MQSSEDTHEKMIAVSVGLFVSRVFALLMSRKSFGSIGRNGKDGAGKTDKSADATAEKTDFMKDA